MPVPDELTRLSVRCCKTEPHKNIVEALFELSKQVFAGYALLADGLLEIRPELVFKDAVDAFDFLLLTQLQAVSDDLRFTITAVLSGRKVPFFDPACRFEAALAFQEQFHSFSAAESANRTYISSQCVLLELALKLFVVLGAGTRCGV